MVHLDLLVLLGFGVSHIFFQRGRLDISVPLGYPPLIYLLARMLWIGVRGSGAGLRPMLGRQGLTLVLLFLVAFRIVLNVAGSTMTDVGYAGAIGAHKIASGQALYGAFPTDNPYGDTYGPVNYAAYVPFEQLLPWSGRWDSVPAAHAATIAFDLATHRGYDSDHPRVVGDVGFRELVGIADQDACHVQGHVAVADDHGATARQVWRHLLEVRMRVVPTHEVDGGHAAF